MRFLSRTLSPLALVALLAFTLPACAQSQSKTPRAGAAGPGGDRVERQVESLREAVDLTDAQEKQVRAIFEANAAERPQRDGARGSGNREAMRAQRDAQRAELNAQIEAILAPDQIERFRAWQTAQRQNQGGRRGGGRGNGGS